MTEGKLTELKYGFETAFIDAGVSSNLAYKPQFVSNNYIEGSWKGWIPYKGIYFQKRGNISNYYRKF